MRGLTANDIDPSLLPLAQGPNQRFGSPRGCAPFPPSSLSLPPPPLPPPPSPRAIPNVIRPFQDGVFKPNNSLLIDDVTVGTLLLKAPPIGVCNEPRCWCYWLHFACLLEWPDSHHWTYCCPRFHLAARRPQVEQPTPSKSLHFH